MTKHEDKGTSMPFAVKNEPELHCPACNGKMSKHDFERQPIGKITLDICFHCQGIWFDEYESLQLSPRGLIALFKQIHEHREETLLPWRDTTQCPRCREALEHVTDLTKNGKFSYHGCLNGHGRFNSFSSFMAEKGFVRQLKKNEIVELASKVKTIRCTGCGAPVDIKTDIVCNHCKSPIVVLDPNAVEKALHSLNQKALSMENVNPNAIADMLLEGERHKERIKRERREQYASGEGAVLVDLLIGGASLIFKILE